MPAHRPKSANFEKYPPGTPHFKSPAFGSYKKGFHFSDKERGVKGGFIN
jgi:hypothetical protein